MITFEVAESPQIYLWGVVKQIKKNLLTQQILSGLQRDDLKNWV